MGSFMSNEFVFPLEDHDHLWELFHENSKIGRHSSTLSNEEILEGMSEFHEALAYEGYPTVDLPEHCLNIPATLSSVILTRASTRDLLPQPISLDQLNVLLQYGYGLTRKNSASPLPAFFRTVPSGGGLYPLEIFAYVCRAQDFEAGLYHFNPPKRQLNRLRDDSLDLRERVASALVYPQMVHGASLVIFLTGLFERSTFKYGERGYRFILLEAGHVAQNINLTANALGLGGVNLGGFFDREIDALLDLDGVTHSTLYILAIGGIANSSGNDDSQ
ncbi:MAG: SagB/ThcOx family dehydrogenase [Nitrospira sp.]|nr:SagB/ThcOx family dehydrogenase [Nitrospira sp.]